MEGQAAAEKPAITVSGKVLRIDRLGVTLALRRLRRSDVQNALAYANGVAFGSEGVYLRTLTLMAITKVDGDLRDGDGEPIPAKQEHFVSRGIIERMAPLGVYDVLDDDEQEAILAFALEHLSNAAKKA